MNKIINREAADKTKGFRLQKLRVACLILDAIEEKCNAHIYSSIEHIEDVYVNYQEGLQRVELLEEDKCYDPSSSFTLNSSTILNTFISFLDAYISKGMSDNIYLGFYTTNKYGKERETEFSKNNNIIFPKLPMFKYLIECNISSEFIKIFKKIILNEYIKQYPKEGGHYKQISSFDERMWKHFFSRIKYAFGQADHEELKLIALNKIASSSHFLPALEGFEHSILTEILEIYDERQFLDDPTEKFVHAANIEVIFLKMLARLTSECKSNDPIYNIWHNLDEPSDKRNIGEKFLSISPNYSNEKLGHLARVVSRSRYEEEQCDDKRSLAAMKYRLYEYCNGEIANRGKISSEEIDDLLAYLYKGGEIKIESLSKKFYYKYNADDVINGLILGLFDSCYLSFD